MITPDIEMTAALQAMWVDSEREGSVRQRLDSVLRQAIIRMVLPPGRALSEKEISKSLDISRQPVREAFIRLSEIGLIEVLPQRGTYVVGISLSSVHEARFVREAIEVAVARRAAEDGLHDGVFTELYELIEQQKRCIGQPEYDRFFMLDEAFHRTLSLGAGQRTAWIVTEKVKAHLDRVRYLSVPDTTPIETLIAQHTEIVDAVAKRDADTAESSMRVHQREILESLPDLLRRFPKMYDQTSQMRDRLAGIAATGSEL